MSGWQPIEPDHFLNQPGPHAAELNQYLAANRSPEPIPDEGMHLPTLEAVRLKVQERVDQSEAELGRLNAEGIQVPYAEGYISAMVHVLDYLDVLAGGRP